MDSFRVSLQSEYKALQQEMKKHHLKIQNDINDCIKILSDSDKFSSTLSKHDLEVLLRPIGLIVTVRAYKLFLRWLSILQKISMMSFMNKLDNILLIMQLLLPMCQDEDNEEMVQIKLLQIIMLFLDPKNWQIDRQLIKLILVCIFKLYETNSSLVKNTALATLRQLFSLIFEKLNSVSAGGSSGDLWEIAMEMLDGLYCTFDPDYENNPNWPLDSNRENMWLALDLYWLCIPSLGESIIQPYNSHINSNFNKDEDLDIKLKNLTQILTPYLKEITDYKFGIRLLRLFNLLIIHLHIGLNPYLEFMSDSGEKKPWISRVIFESYSILFTKQSIVSLIFTEQESVDLLESCLAIMQKYLEINKAELEIKEKSEDRKPMPRFLEQRMIETEKPDPKLPQMMLLWIETSTGLVDVLSNLMFPKGLNSSMSSASNDMDESVATISIPFSISKFILRILSILLEKSSKDISIQSLLNSIQVYINMSGIKQMSKERDAFLR